MVAALLLGGCGGEEEVPVDVSGYEGGAYTGEEPLLEGEDCDAEVFVDGDAPMAWEGPGVAATDEAGGAPAVYQAAYDDSLLTVYAAERQARPRITLDVDGDVYAAELTKADAKDVSPDGEFAVLEDLTAAGDPDGSVQVTASFNC